MDGNRSAFPFAECQTFDEDKGLTKRELFAAMAMQGMLSDEGVDVGATLGASDCAKRAVKFADALLEALK